VNFKQTIIRLVFFSSQLYHKALSHLFFGFGFAFGLTFIGAFFFFQNCALASEEKLKMNAIKNSGKIILLVM